LIRPKASITSFGESFLFGLKFALGIFYDPWKTFPLYDPSALAGVLKFSFPLPQ
jgi:hypothetical protein